MEPDREQWLRNLIEALDRVIANGGGSDDAWHRMIIEDAVELRERILGELEAR